jgi:hypothetical protein
LVRPAAASVVHTTDQCGQGEVIGETFDEDTSAQAATASQKHTNAQRSKEAELFYLGTCDGSVYCQNVSNPLAQAEAKLH